MSSRRSAATVGIYYALLEACFGARTVDPDPVVSTGECNTVHGRYSSEEGMAKRRRWFTPAQRNELWARWQAGHTLDAISAGLALSPSGIFGVVQGGGGVRPAPMTRSARVLSHAERL